MPHTGRNCTPVVPHGGLFVPAGGNIPCPVLNNADRLESGFRPAFRRVGDPMKIINRAAVVVTLKEPYLHWAASQHEETADEVHDPARDVSIYLVPEDPKEEEETAPLEDFFEEIFDDQLEGWCTDETAWPAVRDLRTFLEWFDVRGMSIVLDLGKGTIVREEY